VRKANGYSRREFVALAVATPFMAAGLSPLGRAKADSLKISSPNGKIQFAFVRDVPYSVVSLIFRGSHVLSARLGLVIDDVDVGQGIVIDRSERFKLNESYATRGVHSTAKNYCNGARVSVTHPATKTQYTIEIRAYDDGVAFRYLVPGEGIRVPLELTSFRFGDAYAPGFMTSKVITKASTKKRRSRRSTMASGWRRR
jgi:alpha-glucosidase